MLLLLYGDTVGDITAIHHTLQLGFSPLWLGVTYLTVAGLAALGMVRKVGSLKLNIFGSLLVVLPQQFLLMFSAVGACVAIYHSQFADGVVRPRAFLAADQCPAIFLAIFHTCALVDLHVRRLFWRSVD